MPRMHPGMTRRRLSLAREGRGAVCCVVGVWRVGCGILPRVRPHARAGQSCGPALAAATVGLRITWLCVRVGTCEGP